MYGIAVTEVPLMSVFSCVDVYSYDKSMIQVCVNNYLFLNPMDETQIFHSYHDQTIAPNGMHQTIYTWKKHRFKYRLLNKFLKFNRGM